MNYKDIFEKLGKMWESFTSDTVTSDLVKINRDITEFRGSILNLGGTSEELKRYKRYTDDPSLKEKIYTVNLDPQSNADLIADFSSKSQMKELPDKRFDIIYFSGVPTADINLQDAFDVAARLLKDDGILLFSGGVKIPPGQPNKNPVIGMASQKKYDVIDVPTLLAHAGFKQGKPLRELELDPNSSQLVAVPPEGARFIASKSVEQIDLPQIYQRFPEFKAIVADRTDYHPDLLASEFKTHDSRPPKR